MLLEVDNEMKSKRASLCLLICVQERNYGPREGKFMLIHTYDSVASCSAVMPIDHVLASANLFFWYASEEEMNRFIAYDARGQGACGEIDFRQRTLQLSRTHACQ